MEDFNYPVSRSGRFAWLERPRNLSSLSLLGLVGLTSLLMAPTLRTGYLSDDALTSLTPGILRFHGWSLTTRVLETIRFSMQEGRFNPLTWIPFSGVFYLFQTVGSYKVFMLVMIITDTIVFYKMISRLFGDPGLACLATSLSLMLFQLRAFHDPILSFFGTVQLV